MKKSSLLALLAPVILSSPATAAVLVTYTSFSNSPDNTPNFAFTGFTASVTQDLTAETTGGSTDGTFGTLASPVAATGDGYARVTTAMAYTVTNGTASSWQLTDLNFDSVSNQGSPTGAPFTVTYVLAGGSAVTVGSGTSTYVDGLGSGSASDYSDYDFTLSSVVLAPGQSIVFTIDPTSSMRVDNLALSGTIVPEPATALLAAMGVLPLLRRRVK